MEVQLKFFALLCLLLPVFILLKRASRNRKTAPTLPPGPWKLPLLGNIHQLGSDLHRALADLSLRHGPLMHLQLGELSVVVVSSAAVAKEVMKTHDLVFSGRPQVLGTSILTYGASDVVNAPYGDRWRQLRKICILELLSSKRVQSFAAVREAEVGSLVRSISAAASSPVNLSDMLFRLTNDVTARSVFSDKCGDQALFKAAMDEALTLVGGFDFADLFPSSKWMRMMSGSEKRFRKIHEKFDRIVSGMIEAREENKRGEKRVQGGEDSEDLLDVLLRLQKHNDLEFDLTSNNIKAVIFDMFVAGTETSATTMEWAMSQLIKNPRVMKKAQAEVRIVMEGKTRVTEMETREMSYLRSVIKETLRVCPPVPLLVPREAMEDCQIDGYEIPQKTRVVVNFWAIARDPNSWENPEEFRPERFLGSSVDFKGQSFEFIPFGAGRRGCPGIFFAMAIIELTLASLLHQFDWKLPGGVRNEDLDMREAFGMSMARKVNLIVVPVPHLS